MRTVLTLSRCLNNLIVFLIRFGKAHSDLKAVHYEGDFAPNAVGSMVKLSLEGHCPFLLLVFFLLLRWKPDIASLNIAQAKVMVINKADGMQDPV